MKMTTAIVLGVACAGLGCIFLVLRGWSTSVRRPARDIWTTYQDGPLPVGENGYFDASESIFENDEYAKRYESYAFVFIRSARPFRTDDDARKLLATSIAQCRDDYALAYHRRKLRQVDSLVNIYNKYDHAFRPRNIVFLLRFPNLSNDGRAGHEDADFGAIISVQDVFGQRETPQSLAAHSKIVCEPERVVGPTSNGQPNKYWRDTLFTIINDFENDPQEHN